MISLPCGMKKQEKINKMIMDRQSRLVVARDGGWTVGEMGEGCQKVHISSFKIHKS